MQLDYKNTDLVVFGDSFTFGQGVFPIPGPSKTLINNEQIFWKERSNNISYVNLVSNKLGFKSCFNYAIPGCSNPGILSIMRSYYKQNPTNKNVLYVVGLTTPDRDTIMRYTDHKEKYDIVDFTYNHWLQGYNENKNKNAVKTNGFDSPLYYGISKRSMEEYLTHYWNNFTILLKHAEFYFSMIDFFESRGLNYIILDVVNDTIAKIETYNLLDKLDESGWLMHLNINHNIDSIIPNYYIEAKSNKRYLNWNSLRDIKKFVGTDYDTNIKAFQNLNHYVLQYGVNVFGDMNKLLSVIPDDKHWSKKGHMLVADLVSDFIQKNYKDIS